MSDDLLVYDAAPSERDIPTALLAAFWAYAHLIRVILPPASPDPFVRFYREHMPRFFNSKEAASTD